MENMYHRGFGALNPLRDQMDETLAEIIGRPGETFTDAEIHRWLWERAIPEPKGFRAERSQEHPALMSRMLGVRK